MRLGRVRPSKRDGQDNVLQAIGSFTPAGRLVTQVIGCFAGIKRGLIRERTSAGLAVAWAEGCLGRRSKKSNTATRCEIAESVVTGRKIRAGTARLYGVGPSAVSRIVAEHRANAR